MNSWLYGRFLGISPDPLGGGGSGKDFVCGRHGLVLLHDDAIWVEKCWGHILVNKVFEPLIGKTMEVYVDDMITKSVKENDHARDLEETFKLLRTYVMKLNPKKCTFGIKSGKFLGYMIDQWEIEANPDKV